MSIIELIRLIADVLTSVGIIGALVALIWQFRSFRREQQSFKREQQTALREATLPFFRVWWGAEFWLEGEQTTVLKLRTTFYRIIVGSPNDKPEDTILAKLGKKWKQSPFGLGKVKDHLEPLFKQRKVSLDPKDADLVKDPDSLRKLTFFFDMIGWLGAHGLIDVDYILGPMQHHMRRTWWVAKPLIETDRQFQPRYWLDPVRHYGFQWLFEYSEKHNQADIINDRFSELSIVNIGSIEALKTAMHDDETRFKAHLRSAGWPTDDDN